MPIKRKQHNKRNFGAKRRGDVSKGISYHTDNPLTILPNYNCPTFLKT